jgi:hypothetical protein
MRLTRPLFCSLVLAICLTFTSSAAPNSYYGRWRVADVVAHSYVTAISPKEIDSIIGTILEINPDYYLYRKQRFDGALYKEREEDLIGALDSDYRSGKVVIEDKSLLSIKDPVTMLDVFTHDGKTVLGGFCYSSDGRLLLLLKGYFLDLCRTEGAANGGRP